jgi:signal transduction histidine kinase
VAVDYKAFPILYVDDEPANLTAFLYVMADEFDVVTASNAQDALNILAQRPVAVLLADQRMPGMTGSQLCARVRELYPDTARMIVSAYADMTAAVEAINSGQVNRYILKPWREAELTLLLRSGVEAYQLGQLVRSLQVRLMDSQQQAGAHLVVSRMLHELANPAAAIQGLVGMMADSSRALVDLLARNQDPHKLALEIRDISKDAVEATQALVSRLHRFRLGDTPTTPGQRRPGMDLGRAVTSAVAIVRNELQKRARLEVVTDGEVAPVAVDPTHASQILVNLLMNAHEALDPTRLPTNRVEVRLHQANGMAVMQVSDTGSGIEADKLPHIFDDYFSTKASGPGRGLGLAIVRDLVQGAGGTVVVRSQPGAGTTFTVELPLANPQ